MASSRDPSSRAGRPSVDRSLEQDEEPLQQDDWTAVAAPPDWLIDVDAANEARDVDRLQGDSEMLLQLQLAGYEGKVWDYFVDVLARYGFAVLQAWLLRGVMLQKCRQKGLRGLPLDGLGFLSPPDAAELAGETVAVAIHFFREEVLVPNRWDPRRGASLRTFFIGQCLIRFPSVYRRWRAQERESNEHPVEHVPDEPADEDPEDTAVKRVEIEAALGDLDDRTKQVLRLYADDVPQEEIAQRMGGGMTVRSVEAILYRHRRRQERKGA